MLNSASFRYFFHCLPLLEIFLPMPLYANKLLFVKDIFAFAANQKQANQKKNFQIIYQQQNEAFILTMTSPCNITLKFLLIEVNVTN